MNEPDNDNPSPDPAGPPGSPEPQAVPPPAENMLMPEVTPEATPVTGPRFLAPPPRPLLFSGAQVVPASLLPRSSSTETPSATKELVLFWCVGVLGTWVISNIQDGANTATRWIMFSCMAGLCLVWPAFRLSQDRVTVTLRPGQRPPGSSPDFPGPNGQEGNSESPLALVRLLRLPSQLFPQSPSATMTAMAPITASIVFIDWFHLILITQVIVWPLHYQRGWSLAQTLAIDAAFLLWSLLAAAIIVIGAQFKTSGARTIAMACCIAIFFGEPLLLFLFHWLPMTLPMGLVWDMQISPIQMVWELSMDSTEFELSAVFRPFLTIAVLAAWAWAWVLRRILQST